MHSRMNIAMVSDFFYPDIGGIETHVIYLSRVLISRGHNVIGISHSREGYSGVVYLGPMKVYYLNLPLVGNTNTCFPFLFGYGSQLIKIFKDEEIEIVHSHQIMSSLGIEAIFHAHIINLKTVLTSHSLFERGLLEVIIAGKLVGLVLKQVSMCIGVSNTTKENIYEVLDMEPERIIVIPNAIDEKMFYNKKKVYNKEEIIIICINRLTVRKGISLMAEVIPIICKLNKKIKVMIGGDGPQRNVLEQMIDENDLKDRVKLLGAISHEKVPELLWTGDIFLNCSLTEAFCMSILEAAFCGLLVVSTDVGGVYEVLPDEMIILKKPHVDNLVDGILDGITKLENYTPTLYMDILKKTYSWECVTSKTEDVYRNLKVRHRNFNELLGCYKKFSGFLFKLVITVTKLTHQLITFCNNFKGF